MFVRILEYVAEATTRLDASKKIHSKNGNTTTSVQAADRLVNRSMENGQRVYEQAACNRCHTINGKGAKYGPDLTDIAKRFKGSKLLQQCVKPSAEIHKEYQTQQILVDDGRLLTGLVVEETDDQIRRRSKICSNQTSS